MGTFDHLRAGFVSFSLAACAIGCGGANPAPANAVAPATVTSANPASLRHRNHGGAIRLVTVALQDLGDLTVAQRATLEKMRGELIAQLEPGRMASADLANALADGVAVGAVDTARVDLAVTRVGEENQRLHAVTLDALDRLHATLTPEQRATLVARMQVLWEGWRKSSEERAGEPEAPSDLTVLAGELGLTPAQVDRIHARFAGALANVTVDYYPRDVANRMDTFGAAFQGERFEARALAAGPDPNANAAPWGARRMASYFEAFAPELDAAQRATLARIIRDHVSRHDQP